MIFAKFLKLFMKILLIEIKQRYRVLLLKYPADLQMTRLRRCFEFKNFYRYINTSCLSF